MKSTLNTAVFSLIPGALACCLFLVPSASHGITVGSDNNDISLGLPLGGDSAAENIDLCPRGAETIYVFMSAWQKNDYETMYALIDDKSKAGYPFGTARFDLQFMEFKEYKISSVRKNGNDFEFLLSYGDWKDGDKENAMILISGESFKIIMPSKNTIFKKSMDSYF
ncbi:MAG: hypothetical protein ABH883_02425 [Candidatus Omnitrophota bacterium]